MPALSHRILPPGRPEGDRIVTPKEMSDADAVTIAQYRVPGIALMENASRHVAAAVAEHVERIARTAARPRIGIVCGGGNNGGDGLGAARHLAGWGHPVDVWLTTPRDRYAGDAATNLAACDAIGLPVRVAPDLDALPPPGTYALLVDALLGTGLRGEVRGLTREIIGWINHHGAPVIAVDIPSGVDGETGSISGDAVHAVETVTFAAAKPGHWLHPGAARRGLLTIVDIGMPTAALARAPRRRILGDADLAPVRAPRDPDSHKGRQGHVGVLGGSPGKSGSIRLCGDAALRAGAGLVTLATTPALARELGPQLYEAMTEGTLDPDRPDAADRLAARLNTFDAIAAGPGLPTDETTGALLEAVLPHVDRPLVLDADGLNHAARRPALLAGPAPRIITPHPGEAARLLGCATADVQRDRFGAAARLFAKYGAVVVLKGAGTIVHAADEVALCPDGNPGMASAGMGDVLTGIIAALLARGMSAALAARAGVVWHARAGDAAAAHHSQDHLIARDLIAALAEGARDRRC